MKKNQKMKVVNLTSTVRNILEQTKRCRMKAVRMNRWKKIKKMKRREKRKKNKNKRKKMIA